MMFTEQIRRAMAMFEELLALVREMRDLLKERDVRDR